jgi:hypothetical protein
MKKLTKYYLICGLAFSTILNVGCTGSSSGKAGSNDIFQKDTNDGSESKQTEKFSSKGVINGGGGKGVKCGTTVTTLDLWEAVNVHGLTLKPELSTLNQEFLQGAYAYSDLTNEKPLDRTPQMEAMILKSIQEEILDRQVYITSGTRLPATADATLPKLPTGCEFVQIAIYADDGKIYFDREYSDALALQAFSSLVLHEFAYLKSRRYGNFNSDEARRVIGKIFSTAKLEPNFPDLRGRKYVACGAGGGSNGGEIFEIVFNEETQNGILGLGVYFAAVKNEYMLTKTYGFLPGATLAQIASKNFPTQQIQIENRERKTILSFEIGVHTNHGRPMAFVRAWAPGEALPAESWSICNAL